MGQYFSLKLESKKQVNKLVLNDSREGILIEGSLGEFENCSIIEDKLLEISCKDGILLLELSKSMLTQLRPTLIVSTDKK